MSRIIRRGCMLCFACLWASSAFADSPSSQKSKPKDKQELVARFRAVVEGLDSLSFTQKPTIDDSPMRSGRSARDRTEYTSKVWMRRDGAVRVDASSEGKPVAIIVRNAEDVWEWDADENLWTRYPVSSGKKGAGCPGLLVTDGNITGNAECWLGKPSLKANLMEESLSDPSFMVRRPRKHGGRKCDVVVGGEVDEYEDGGIKSTTKNLAALWFDRETGLIARIDERVEAKVLFRFQYNRRDAFEEVRLNPKLAEDLFTFKPPEGSQYISPDDERFKKEEETSLDGSPAPSIALFTLDGKKVTLSDYTGKKVVLLVFWATWCGPCRKEIPSLCKLHEEFKNQGVRIIGVSTDSDAATTANFLKKKPVPYLILCDEKGASSEGPYRTRSIPKTYLIDSKGTIVKSWSGWNGKAEEEEIRTEITKVLKTKSPD